jgi:hypothetical protein
LLSKERVSLQIPHQLPECLFRIRALLLVEKVGELLPTHATSLRHNRLAPFSELFQTHTALHGAKGICKGSLKKSEKRWRIRGTDVCRPNLNYLSFFA